MGVWVQAARPKTLTAAVAPVLMGTALAVRDQTFHAGAAVAALLGAVLIQIGTNYANDYFDFVKGADDPATRLGPTRATASGAVHVGAMRTAFLVAFGLAIVVGAYLVFRAGWPVVAIGLVGVLLGVLYTGGPAPLAYVGLGDIAVLVFFGPVAVAGTYYVQALRWSGASIVAGLAPGLIATALLAVNNLRDVDEDRAAHKRTLAVRFGRGFAKAQILLCLVGAAAVPVLLRVCFDAPVGVWWALVGLAPAALALPAVLRGGPGDRLAKPLAMLGLTLLTHAIAFALGWLA